MSHGIITEEGSVTIESAIVRGYGQSGGAIADFGTTGYVIDVDTDRGRRVGEFYDFNSTVNESRYIVRQEPASPYRLVFLGRASGIKIDYGDIEQNNRVLPLWDF